MEGVAFKGGIKDVLADLEMEAKRLPTITVGEYLRLRKIEKAVSSQFGERITPYRSKVNED